MLPDNVCKPAGQCCRKCINAKPNNCIVAPRSIRVVTHVWMVVGVPAVQLQDEGFAIFELLVLVATVAAATVQCLLILLAADGNVTHGFQRLCSNYKRPINFPSPPATDTSLGFARTQETRTWSAAYWRLGWRVTTKALHSWR